jgi:hypothetical protein
MRVPLSWLAEYVDLAPGTTPEDVHAALVKVGFEEEDIHRSDVTGPVVVGEVLEFVEEEQSNGKSIRWCQVRVAKPLSVPARYARARWRLSTGWRSAWFLAATSWLASSRSVVLRLVRLPVDLSTQ